MSDFSQRGGLASLLSCPAPGRPPHLEGEAARPFFDAYRPNLLARLPPFPGRGRGLQRALSRKDEQTNFLERRACELRRITLPRTPLNKASSAALGFAKWHHAYRWKGMTLCPRQVKGGTWISAWHRVA